MRLRIVTTIAAVVFGATLFAGCQLPPTVPPVLPDPPPAAVLTVQPDPQCNGLHLGVSNLPTGEKLYLASGGHSATVDHNGENIVVKWSDLGYPRSGGDGVYRYSIWTIKSDGTYGAFELNDLSFNAKQSCFAAAA